jgi:tetratricopeptide (TPR) repeat protein
MYTRHNGQVDGDRLPRDRFQIISRLGEGAFGVVYEARDRARAERMAVKVLHRMGADALLRFKQEFWALRNLRHPNLVRLEELIEQEGRWYITMELVRGSDILSYVRRGALRRRGDRESSRDLQRALPGFDEERLRHSLAQLFEGLDALHRADKVHRDIKPSNVRVSHDGRVVLLDFGLVHDQQSDPSTAPSVVGTAAYMSPEQAASEALTGASDWYSVGVLLYEALTGARPFTGSPLQIMLDKQRREPVRPSEVAQGVPSDLDALCMALLAIDPTRRPNAEQAFEYLGTGSRGSRPLMRAPFVGREAELARLLAVLEAHGERRGAAFYLHGEAGTGKTRVLTEFSSRIRSIAPEALVLRGRCHESETVPYKAFDGIIDGLSRHLRQLGASEARKLLPDGTQTLGEVFPVLSRADSNLPSKTPGPAREPWVLRDEVFKAVHDLFARLGSSTQVVLLIDDLHWADIESVHLLERLTAGPQRPAMVLIAAGRAPVRCPVAVRRVIAQGLSLPPGGLIELACFSAAEGEGFASDLLLQRVPMLEAETAPLSSLARSVAREAEGQPFLIELLVRQADPLALARGEAPALAQTLQACIDALSPEERLTLELLAVTGAPVRLRILADAISFSLTFMTDLAARLTALGLANEDGSGDELSLSVVQERIRAAALRPLGPKAIAERHERLARALLAAGGHDVEALAVHLGESGDRETAAHYALLAAGAAYDALAFERAARLFRVALDLHPGDVDPRRRRRLYARLGDALAGAGRSEEAADAYRAAVDAAPGLEGADLQTRAAQYMVQAGRLSEGVAEIRALLRARGHRYPTSQAGSIASLLYSRARLKLRGIEFEERGATWIAPERLAEVDLLWSVSCSLSMVDVVRAADIQTRHLLSALDAGEPYRVARALAIEGWIQQAGAPVATPEISAIFARARLLAGNSVHPHAQAIVALCEGASANMICRFEEALQRCEHAERLLRERCRAVTWEIDSAQYIAGLARLFLGRFDEVCRLVPQQIREARDRGDRYAETLLRIAVGFWPSLFADKVDDVVRDIEDAMKSWQALGSTQVVIKFVSFANVYLYARPDEAYDVLSREILLLDRTSIARVPSLRVLVHAYLAQAALAGALANKGRAPQLLGEARKLTARLAKEALPSAAPYAAMLRGAIAAQVGDRARAISELHEAHAGFTALDMSMYAAAASYREGQLLDGAQGQLLVTRAIEWERGLAVAPERRLLQAAAPGYPE